MGTSVVCLFKTHGVFVLVVERMQQIYNVFVEELKNSLEIVSQESCFFACSLEVACIFPLQVLSNIQERAITFVYYTDLPISL
jgi:hypothetical protein